MVVVVVVVMGLVALVALYCNGLASNSWYVLVGQLKYFSSFNCDFGGVPWTLLD